MTNFFAPLHAKSLEPLALDMQSLFLTGQVFPFGAKLNVAHVFRSNEKSAVEVVYSFALPRDASLVGFRIEGQGFCISSRLEPRTQAERRYEEAMEAGSLAAITQQNRDGIVNLTVGNLRPGETVSVRLDLVAGVSLKDGGFRLRFPFTVAPCYHPQMRASLNGRNIGTIELPDAVGGGLFLPPMHKDAEPLHEVGFDLRIEPAQGIREVASPSHSIRMSLGDPTMVGVKLSPDRDVPNRDLVLDVSRDFGSGQAWSDRHSGSRKHFGLIVPSSALGQQTEQARRVVFVLDRSGSMQGAPIKQARTALENCLATLSLDDHFGIVAFDNTLECFRPGMLPASRDNLQAARQFLSRTEARGGTELAHAIEAAAKLLAGRGEIFVITDGQVFGTVEILRRARKCEARLFCLAIGSASQDRFLELLARQTGGVCRFVTPAERMESAAKELFTALGGTVATNVQVEGANLEPPSAGPVFRGTPFFAFGDIDADANQMEVRWAGGVRSMSFEALRPEAEGLLEKLQGARLIADLEAADMLDAYARRRLLKLSERFGLSSSEMSLVAVVERVGDRPGDVPKTRIVPVGMAHQVVFGAVGFEAMISRRTAAACPPPSRFSGFDGASAPAFAAMPMRSGAGQGVSKDDLADVLHDVVRIIDDYGLVGAGNGADQQVDGLLKRLIAADRKAKNDQQKKSVAALIDFMTSNLVDFLESGQFCFVRWAEIRLEIKAAWPESALA